MNVWLNAYKRLCYANVFTCSFGNHKYFMARKQLVDLIFSLGKDSWVRALIAEKSELVIYQTRSHSQRILKIRVIKKPFQNSYNKITFAAECEYILIYLICSLVGLQKEGTVLIWRICSHPGRCVLLETLPQELVHWQFPWPIGKGSSFHTEVHRSGSWSLRLSGSGTCCPHSDIAVCAVCTVLL